MNVKILENTTFNTFVYRLELILGGILF